MKIKSSQRIAPIQEYYFSKKLREIAAMNAAGAGVINLGIGSPDLAPSTKVIERLQEASNDPKNHAYQSYAGIIELRNAYAEWYKRVYKVTLNPVNEILPLMGSKEGIMHISMAFLDPGDAVLIPNPGYPTYSAAATLAGATIQYYELSEGQGWLPNFEVLEKEDLSKTKIMWVNYPHMPTGAKATKVCFEQLLQFAKKHQLLVINDNPYSFILNDEPMSILSIEGAKDYMMELNSLSKSHNMAGWRQGVLSGHADYIKEVLKFKSNMDSGMFKPMQLAAVEALQLSNEWFEKLNQIYRKRQNKVFQLLDLLDCKYSKKQGGMFVWAGIPSSAKDGYSLSDAILKEAKVFITPGGIFGAQGNQYIRVSLCAEAAVFDHAIQRIKDQFLIQTSI